MIITLLCRNTPIYINKNEIEELSDSDWFLSLLINYKRDITLNLNSDTSTMYEIGEDPNLVLSVIESLRYKKVILLSNISLDLMEALCDKWCCPEWLINAIQEKKKEKKCESYDTSISNFVFKCDLCYVGFKLNENKKDSCKRHTQLLNTYYNIYPCCGLKIQSNDDGVTYCTQGYHTPSEYSLKLFKQFKEITQTKKK